MPVLIVFLVVMAVLHQDERRYRVPSESMRPTLDVGDRITVETDAYDHADPERGDIVVFHPPAAAEGFEQGQCGAPVPEGAMCARPTGPPSRVSFIKRVVAGPGDRVALDDGRVILNGRRLAEPYIARCADGAECSFPRTITVPRGMYYMLGDNRGASDDSRFWGPVPKTAIVGRVKGH